MTDTKTITGVTVKDADQGIVELVFATHLVKSLDDATAADVDKGNDVTFKGAYTDGAEVVISAYGHASWGVDGPAQLPVGKGVIHEAGTKAICEAQFFLNTPQGAAAFETIKELGPLQEWSYSLRDVQAVRGQVPGKGSVRGIKSVSVKEISPVLMGEGIDTQTTAVKSVSAERKQLTSTIANLLNDAGTARWGAGYGYTYLDDFDLDDGTAVFCVVDYSSSPSVRSRLMVDFTRTATTVTLGDDETEVIASTQYLAKGLKFSEHVTTVLADVDELTTRAQEVVALRAEKGKAISEDSAELLKRLGVGLDALKALIATPAPTTHLDELRRIELQQIRLAQEVPT